MSRRLRKTGLAILGDLPWGTHCCHFYQRPRDLLDTRLIGLEPLTMQARVTADHRVNDVLARYPSTAPVFVQGRLYVDQPGQLYAQFPGLTVGEFARRNSIELASLLSKVNALAESEEIAPRETWERYGLREDGAPDHVSVVNALSERGPD